MEHLRRRLAASTALLLASGLLAACAAGSSSGDTLTWYINPDAGGQAKVAENCSTDDYTIEVQVLPQSASEQRIQLSRRLAAEDPEIDIMSIDPPYTAEFANAGFLAPIPDDLQSKLKQQSFKGAVDAATWDGELVVAPFWSNTQVLWYRKSFVEKAGLDMNQPVSWDQIIDAAAKNDGKVAVQANKYEGYAVWINALISGAGGSDRHRHREGRRRSPSRSTPPQVTPQRRSSRSCRARAPLRPTSRSPTRARRGPRSAVPHGAFMVNWTYIWTNYDKTQPEVKKDLGYALYPQSTQGEESRPPYGGIGVGVSKYSKHRDEAMQAIECITSPDNQGVNAELTGNMPASAAGYKYPALAKIYPPALLALFQESLDTAAPRTVSPYWTDISGALQSTWHPSDAVDDQTPPDSQQFIEDVLHGRSLL